MLYEVKIKNPDGTIKRVIPTSELEKMYWKEFFLAEKNIGLMTTGKPTVPRWVRSHLSQMFPLEIFPKPGKGERNDDDSGC